MGTSIMNQVMDTTKELDMVNLKSVELLKIVLTYHALNLDML